MPRSKKGGVAGGGTPDQIGGGLHHQTDLHRRVLQRCRLILLKDLDVPQVLEALCSDESFNKEDSDEILALPSRQLRVAVLLDKLENRASHSFDVFMDALLEHYKHLHSVLDESVRNIDSMEHDDTELERVLLTGDSVRKLLTRNRGSSAANGAKGHGSSSSLTHQHYATTHHHTPAHNQHQSHCTPQHQQSAQQHHSQHLHNIHHINEHNYIECFTVTKSCGKAGTDHSFVKHLSAADYLHLGATNTGTNDQGMGGDSPLSAASIDRAALQESGAAVCQPPASDDDTYMAVLTTDLVFTSVDQAVIPSSVRQPSAAPTALSYGSFDGTSSSTLLSAGIYVVDLEQKLNTVTVGRSVSSVSASRSRGAGMRGLPSQPPHMPHTSSAATLPHDLTTLCHTTQNSTLEPRHGSSDANPPPVPRKPADLPPLSFVVRPPTLKNRSSLKHASGKTGDDSSNTNKGSGKSVRLGAKPTVLPPSDSTPTDGTSDTQGEGQQPESPSSMYAKSTGSASGNSAALQNGADDEGASGEVSDKEDVSELVPPVPPRLERSDTRKRPLSSVSEEPPRPPPTPTVAVNGDDSVAAVSSDHTSVSNVTAKDNVLQTSLDAASGRKEYFEGQAGDVLSIISTGENEDVITEDTASVAEIVKAFEAKSPTTSDQGSPKFRSVSNSESFGGGDHSDDDADADMTLDNGNVTQENNDKIAGQTSGDETAKQNSDEAASPEQENVGDVEQDSRQQNGKSVDCAADNVSTNTTLSSKSLSIDESTITYADADADDECEDSADGVEGRRVGSKQVCVVNESYDMESGVNESSPIANGDESFEKNVDHVADESKKNLHNGKNHGELQKSEPVEDEGEFDETYEPVEQRRDSDDDAGGARDDNVQTEAPPVDRTHLLRKHTSGGSRPFTISDEAAADTTPLDSLDCNVEVMTLPEDNPDTSSSDSDGDLSSAFADVDYEDIESVIRQVPSPASRSYQYYLDPKAQPADPSSLGVGNLMGLQSGVGVNRGDSVVKLILRTGELLVAELKECCDDQAYKNVALNKATLNVGGSAVSRSNSGVSGSSAGNLQQPLQQQQDKNNNCDNKDATSVATTVAGASEVADDSNYLSSLAPYHQCRLCTDKTGRVFYIPSRYLKHHGDPRDEPWFYPRPLTTRQATLFLSSERLEGCFLVYKPCGISDPTHAYHLSVARHDGDVYHYGITQGVHGDVAVDSHGMSFLCLADLVRYFRANKSQLVARLGRALQQAKMITTPGVHYPHKWEINRAHLQLNGQIIGKGQFGIICGGTYQHRSVAVKILQKSDSHNSMTTSTDHFLEEAQILMTTKHEHVIKLVGVSCTAWPHYVIIEYQPKGNLRDCLRSGDIPAEHIDLLFDLCIQVTSALTYLDSERYIVHRDVCARNFLVTSDLCVKLSNFGRARRVVDDRCHGDSSEKISIKWAAPEVMTSCSYSTKSDIWSLGVVLWEIFSYGQRPYVTLTGEQTAVYVIDGGVLEKPTGCSPDIYSIMKLCWLLDPVERPTAATLAERLTSKSSIYYGPIKPRPISTHSTDDGRHGHHAAGANRSGAATQGHTPGAASGSGHVPAGNTGTTSSQAAPRGGTMMRGAGGHSPLPPVPPPSNKVGTGGSTPAGHKPSGPPTTPTSLKSPHSTTPTAQGHGAGQTLRNRQTVYATRMEEYTREYMESSLREQHAEQQRLQAASSETSLTAAGLNGTLPIGKDDMTRSHKIRKSLRKVLTVKPGRRKSEKPGKGDANASLSSTGSGEQRNSYTAYNMYHNN